MTVALIFRKKNPAFFSIERVFARLEPELEKKTAIRKVIAPQLGISFRNIMATSSFVKKNKADLYHITGDIHYAALGLPRRRTLLTIHDCVFLYQTKGWKRLILKKLLLDWPVRRSAMVTTISEASKKDILKYTGCAPDKVVVIPNPVNDQIRYRPHEFNSSEPVILFVGATPNKNLPRVIQALENIPCRLLIVGAIPDPARELLHRHGVAYQQKTGLDDEGLAACYADADMVLFPSTFEGFGLPILEAQKAGRPVITSNISPMKEVAGNGACLIDPLSVPSIRDGVLHVIKDATYRMQLVNAGFENIDRFDVKVIAQQYMNCYQALYSRL